MTAIRAYPRNLLLTIKLAVIQAKPRVPLGVLEKLRQNNIYSVPKTHRGVSGEKKSTEYPNCHNNTQANPSGCTGQGGELGQLDKD